MFEREINRYVMLLSKAHSVHTPHQIIIILLVEVSAGKVDLRPNLLSNLESRSSFLERQAASNKPPGQEEVVER